MKRFFFLSLTALALTAATSACSKDTEPSPAPYEPKANSLTGNMDGAALNVTAYSSAVPTDPSQPQEMTLRFYTNAAQSEFIYLHVPVTIVPGTYALTETGLEYVVYHNSLGDYISTSGTLQIGMHDKSNHVITGNFEASMIPAPTSTATGTHDFTNVQFVLNY